MYQHKVQYYETDKMGITHHSNYIRWMEEARIDFLAQAGWGYDKLEAMGIISPVVSVQSSYKKATTFPELINIDVRIEEFNGVRLKLVYEMKNQDDVIVNIGHSEHCFIDANGHPIRMKKLYPDLYEFFHTAK